MFSLFFLSLYLILYRVIKKEKKDAEIIIKNIKSRGTTYRRSGDKFVRISNEEDTDDSDMS